MKKLIAIVTIAIVLVGAVFADTTENHKLQITAHVGEQAPVFQLVYDANHKTNTEDNANRDNVVGADFSSTTYTVNSAIDKTAVDITTANITASVIAHLNSSVKLSEETPYTLTFKADSLKSSEQHDDAYYYIDPITTGSSIVANTAQGGLDAGITMGNPSNLSVTQGTLQGTITATMSVANIAACDLATFTFVYEADPDAPADDYTAYIWLTVSAS